MVEREYPRAGDTLFDERRRHAAKIRADGTLISATAYGDHRGSIHQVGAAVQGAPSCNGWTFWHFQAATDRIAPIDLLRERIRAELGPDRKSTRLNSRH